MFDAIFGRSVKILKILAKVQWVLAFVLASMRGLPRPPLLGEVAMRSIDGEVVQRKRFPKKIKPEN